VTRTPLLGQKVKGQGQGQGHQVALLTAALTREAGAAVPVRTYWAWETTATLRLLGGARGAGAPRGRRGAGHIVSPRAQLVCLSLKQLYRQQAVREAAQYVPAPVRRTLQPSSSPYTPYAFGAQRALRHEYS